MSSHSSMIARQEMEIRRLRREQQELLEALDEARRTVIWQADAWRCEQERHKGTLERLAVAEAQLARIDAAAERADNPFPTEIG